MPTLTFAPPRVRPGPQGRPPLGSRAEGARLSVLCAEPNRGAADGMGGVTTPGGNGPHRPQGMPSPGRQSSHVGNPDDDGFDDHLSSRDSRCADVYLADCSLAHLLVHSGVLSRAPRTQAAAEQKELTPSAY